MKPETIKWIKLAEVELFSAAEPLNIEKIVCDFFEVEEKILYSKNGVIPLPYVRFIIWRIRNLFYKQTLCNLAEKYKKHYTTVLYGKDKSLYLIEYRNFLNHLITKS